jgi:hypothetical protein
VEPPPTTGLGRPAKRMLQGTDRISRDIPDRSRSGWTSLTGTHGALLKTLRTDDAAALPITAGCVALWLNRYYGRLRRPPGPAVHFPGSPVTGRRAPATRSAGHRAGRPPQFPPPLSGRSAPHTPGVPEGCASRHFTASMAFTVISAARLPLLPPSQARPLTTLQTSLNAADRPVAPPYRVSDAVVRPRLFPGEAASLLPGLLPATRTGLIPASDDELTNTEIHLGLRHGLTSHSAGRTKDRG